MSMVKIPRTRPFSEIVELVKTENEIRALNKPRVWFYRPGLFWCGWSTLLPITRGHDEYSRETWVLGWAFTGRMVIADKNPCGDLDCYKQTLSWIADEGMTELEFLESLNPDPSPPA